MSAVLDGPVHDPFDLEAEVNYTAKSAIRPVNYTFEPPPGMPRFSGQIDTRRVTIRNARDSADLGLDVSGFELIRHRSTLTAWTDFSDRERVLAIDYAEVVATLKARTGAREVSIFDHTLRDSSAQPGQGGLREPVRRVHDDQTLESAPKRVVRHLGAEAAASRLTRRFAIVNLWRPIEHEVLRTPLTLCDARSIAQTDLIACDHVYPDWTGEIYSVAYHPRHRWFWFPRQTPEEATLIKIYDSATDGRARLSAHTAFDDPSTTADAPPRRSIEIRAMLFF